MFDWDRCSRESLKQREREFEADIGVCWRGLSSWWPRNGENDELNRVIEFIDCAFKTLSDHLDKIDWTLRGIWKSQGGSITAEFVRDELNPKVMEEIGAHTSELDRKLKWHMHRKGWENRRPVLHHFEHAKEQLKNRMLNLYDEEARQLDYHSAENQKAPAANDNLGQKFEPEQHTSETGNGMSTVKESEHVFPDVAQERASNDNSDRVLRVGQEDRKSDELKLNKGTVVEARNITLSGTQNSDKAAQAVETKPANSSTGGRGKRY